jgi:photosynthesis system II assembly factor YCF48-like protein
MDAKNKDETRQRRREEALVRRLGEAFDHMGPQGRGICPDSERIAAYYERALAPEETAQWEAHFAACARCRKILSVLAASAEAPLADQEVERLGVLASAKQAQPHGAQAAKPERTSGFHWRLRWLVPAFGAAAALAVWFALRPPWRVGDQVSTQILVADRAKIAAPSGAENSVPPGNPASELSNAPARTAAPSSKLKDSQGAKSQAPKAGLDNLVALDNAANDRLAPPDQVANRAAKTAPAQDAAADKKDGLTESSGVMGKAAAAETPVSPSPAAPVPAPLPRPAFAASSAQAEAQALQKQTAPAARAAATPPVSAGQTPEVQTYARNQVRSSGQAVGVVVDSVKVGFPALLKSPSAAVSWRAGAGGSIERTRDAGRTWQPQESPLHEDWVAGAAVTDTLCWLVGRSGAIARATDGEHWERIAPPPQAADASGKQPDWVSVIATDSQTAIIGTQDGQRYATHDGGKTWQKQ